MGCCSKNYKFLPTDIRQTKKPESKKEKEKFSCCNVCVSCVHTCKQQCIVHIALIVHYESLHVHVCSHLAFFTFIALCTCTLITRCEQTLAILIPNFGCVPTKRNGKCITIKNKIENIHPLFRLRGELNLMDFKLHGF